MLKGEGNENGIKINRSNQQKNRLHVQYTFFLISRKINLHVQHAFCLSLPLFCTPTTLFCRTKTSNFLVTHYFCGGIVVCAYPRFCLLCSCSLLFFTTVNRKSLAFGSGFTSFSRVLPTSRVGYRTGKPIESVVYCINNSQQIFQMASTFYKLFTIEIEMLMPYAVAYLLISSELELH